MLGNQHSASLPVPSAATAIGRADQSELNVNFHMKLSSEQLNVITANPAKRAWAKVFSSWSSMKAVDTILVYHNPIPIFDFAAQ